MIALGVCAFVCARACVCAYVSICKQGTGEVHLENKQPKSFLIMLSSIF